MAMNVSETKVVAVETAKELRMISGEIFSFKILSGQMEWNGAELQNGCPHSIPQNTWISLYAINDSEVEVTNSESCYIGKNSVVEEYYSFHTKLNDNRQQLLEGESAQVILVTGPIRSGKGTFSLHLLNYAVQSGFNPLFVDLSLSTNLITVPGCIGCSIVSNVYLPTTQLDYNFNQPLVFCCGTTKPDEKLALYSRYIKLLSDYCAEKIKIDTSVKKSGVIIRCPYMSMDLIKEVVENFKVDLVYVMDNEQLFNDIQTTKFDHFVGTNFVNKPSGIPLCIEYNSFIKKMQHKLVNNYFCGCSPEYPLCPRSSVELDSSYQFITIKSFSHETAGCLPIGQTQVQNPFDVEEVPIGTSVANKNDVCALLNCDSIDEVLNNTANVIGFVVIEDIVLGLSEEKLQQKAVIRSPNPILELPNKILMPTGMKMEYDV